MWTVVPDETSCPALSLVTDGNVAGGIGDLAARGDKAGDFQIGRVLRAGDRVVEDQRGVGGLRRRGIVGRFAAVIERERRRAGDLEGLVEGELELDQRSGRDAAEGLRDRRRQQRRSGAGRRIEEVDT